MPTLPIATVVIVTKDRMEELRAALASAVAQAGHIQILVVDDGSADGTAEMVRTEFPSVLLHREEISQGYIVQRNRAARLASAPIIVSMDDDAVFTSPETVQQTLADFSDDRVGAVAIPFVNVRQGDHVYQRAPSAEKCYVAASFIGTAYAIRREVFLQLGGFREVLFHQGEEEDLCLRLLAAGGWTRLGRADPIHHFESAKRDLRRCDIYGRRNNILFVWLNVPWPYFPIHLLGTTAKGIRFGFRVGRLRTMVYGLVKGYFAMADPLAERKPVPPAVYRLWRDLKVKASSPPTLEGA